ncbi:hypothetical protein [Mycoplana rhizolycopersici]|uniref:DUF2946 domain-containing protein n=1 Tax=Mycoplana rhizolycopersici TaxID=2746702 RepID=A0ABX2QG73_9HYPH|nr:hypothetical protein [Rhizobium rhizolycopersici]NVP56218.1 hypothetical protein [Rhizobium rhizolycopersici]
MRRLLLILAFIAAALSGWTPVMAASLHVATMVSEHAPHDTASDRAAHSEHTGHADRESKKHGGVHPLLCSACFAVISEIDSVRPAIQHESRRFGSGSPLIGDEIMPPVPPPRALPL